MLAKQKGIFVQELEKHRAWVDHGGNSYAALVIQQKCSLSKTVKYVLHLSFFYQLVNI